MIAPWDATQPSQRYPALSTDGVKATVASSPTVDAAKEATEASSHRRVLPKNLRHGISQLSDRECCLKKLVQFVIGSAFTRVDDETVASDR